MIDLKTVVTKYPESLSSAEKLRAYLTDLYPSEKAKINILVSIFSCGIVEEIKKKDCIDELLLDTFEKKLRDDYGYSNSLSRECLNMWMAVYNKEIQYQSQSIDYSEIFDLFDDAQASKPIEQNQNYNYEDSSSRKKRIDVDNLSKAISFRRRVGVFLNIIIILSFLLYIFENSLFVILFFFLLIIRIIFPFVSRIDLDEVFEFSDFVFNDMNTIKHVSGCNSIWKKDSTYRVRNYKYNAGAHTSSSLKKCEKRNRLPFSLKTKADFVCWKWDGNYLIALPGKLLILEKSDLKICDYHDIECTANKLRFIEKGRVPKDAQILDYTWQYVNKNGTPDRRFKYNPQYPICNYGELHLKIDVNNELTFMFSNYNILN